MEILIRSATLEDKDIILKFIEEHWNKNHVFVRYPELFDYYHVFGKEVRFCIAEDQTDKKLYGILGYIKSNNSSDISDLWGSMWKVIPSDYPSLGVAMMKHIRKTTKCRIFAGVGSNPETAIRIFKALRESTGKLDHYYRLADKINYKIANIKEKRIIEISQEHNGELKLIESKEEFIKKYFVNVNMKPFKDKDYILNRYYNHPVNKYKVYGISRDTIGYRSIVILREQHMGDSKVLRIIDFIGEVEDLRGIGNYLQKKLEGNNFEYIDFYCKGINDDILKDMGFIKRMENDTNIIPNYFEPFLQQNIEIHYNTNDDKDFYAFKGDADQDRPNILQKKGSDS
ncbi:hypothetical protein [Lysinibacillus sp. NPDC056232]|uniref:hypothetical protein n=1 Tax=Lysinibacillus sp. NPDC056232 TaxID=3345756 RepID=UPI0035DBA543